MKKSGIGVIVAGMMLASLARADKWETNYEDALKQAKEEAKFVLLDFTGSDWCGWCIRLDKEVFSKKEFKEFAEENLVCVELDYPRRKKLSKKLKTQNDRLAKEYGIRGFPTVYILDPDGNKLVQTGYREGGAKKYVSYLEEVIGPHKSKFKPQAAPAASKKAAAEEKTYELRDWTSTKGAQIHARFVKRSGSTIYLQQADGKKMGIDFSYLSKPDREYLKGNGAY